VEAVKYAIVDILDGSWLGGVSYDSHAEARDVLLGRQHEERYGYVIEKVEEVKDTMTGNLFG
jgi:hypothetical protein